jgi:hypothetical protein
MASGNIIDLGKKFRSSGILRGWGEPALEVQLLAVEQSLVFVSLVDSVSVTKAQN